MATIKVNDRGLFYNNQTAVDEGRGIPSTVVAVWNDGKQVTVQTINRSLVYGESDADVQAITGTFPANPTPLPVADPPTAYSFSLQENVSTFLER